MNRYLINLRFRFFTRFFFLKDFFGPQGGGEGANPSHKGSCAILWIRKIHGVKVISIPCLDTWHPAGTSHSNSWLVNLMTYVYILVPWQPLC